MNATVKHKCGVFGVWGPAEVAQRIYIGLYAQQHRGQESAGIATTDGERLRAHAGMGLVSEVFTPQILDRLPGKAASATTAIPPPVRAWSATPSRCWKTTSAGRWR